MLRITSKPTTVLPAGELSETAGAERLSPRDIARFIRRYAVLIGAWVVFALACGTVYILTAVPTYIAVSQVLIEPRRATSLNAGPDLGLAQYSLDSAQLESQIQVIKSEQVSKPVVRGLHLEQDAEFASPRPPLVSRILGMLSNPGASAPSAQDDVSGRETTSLGAFADHLYARRVGQSYVIEVSFWSENAEKAARICNSAVAAYIRDRLSLKAEAAQSGSEILERRISSLREQQEAADRAIRTGVLQADAFPSSDARLITVASVPRAKSWPRSSLVLALSSLFGLFTGLLVAAIHHSLDASVRTPAQVEGELGLNWLGTLPYARRSFGKLLDEVARRPFSPFSGALQQMKTGVYLARMGATTTCLGVVSVARGEGKTTIASNLAQAFAASNSRTLLIDADAQERKLTRHRHAKATAGLFELLNDEQLLDRVLVQGAPNEPDFIPLVCRRPLANSGDVLGSAQMDDLLRKLRQTYAVIVIDLPSLETAPDARAIGPLLDALLLVAQYGRVPADRIRQGVKTFEQADVKILGGVLNKSRDASGS